MHASLHGTADAQRAPPAKPRARASQPQLTRLDVAVCALVTNQPAVRPMLIRVLRYLRLGFEMVREKVLNELSDLSALSVNERTDRVHSCRAATLQLAMAHEVGPCTMFQLHVISLTPPVVDATGLDQHLGCDPCNQV